MNGKPRALNAVMLSLLLLTTGCNKDPEAAKREHVKKGDEYVAEKKYREAIVEFRNAVQIDPRLADARTKLAAAYMAVGEPANAFAHYVRAADLLPSDPQAQVRAGEMLLMAGSFEDARGRAEQALAIDRTNIIAQVLRANALASLRNVDEAVRQLDEAIKLAPDRSEAYASLGALQLSKGRAAEAEAAFIKATEAAPGSVDARLALAQFYAASLRPNEAEKQFTEALRIQPNHYLANRAMAAWRIQQDRAADAEPYLKRIADVAPDDVGKLVLADYYVMRKTPDRATPLLRGVIDARSRNANEARIRLASLATVAGNTTEATDLINQILKSDPRHLDALLAKAQLEVNVKKFDEATATLRSAAEVSPDSHRVRFAMGKLHLARHDPDSALASFKEALRLDPNLGPAEVEMARLHLSARRPDQALTLVDAALQKNPRNSEAYLVRTQALVALGQLAAADKTLKVVASADPESTAVANSAARLQLAKGDGAGARATYHSVLQKDTKNVAAIRGLVSLDLDAGNTQAARQRIEGAVAADSKNPELLVVAGASYGALKDFAASERFLKQAIEIDPSYLQAYTTLTRIYEMQGRLDEAINDYKAIAERQRYSVAVQTTYGRLLETRGRTAEAKEVYHRVIEMDPAASLAANNLAWIYAEANENLDFALQLARSASAKLPDDPAVNDTLGWVYYKKGMPQLAIQPLEASVAKAPQNAVYRLHLGLALSKAGQSAKAKAALETALKLRLSEAGEQQAKDALASLKGV